MSQSTSEFMKQFMATHKDFRIVEVVSGFCESHGPYTNNRVVQTFEDGTEKELPLLGCPECRNEDNIREGVEAMKDSRVGLRIEEIGIPAKFASCTVNGFITTDSDRSSETMKQNVKNKVILFVNGEIQSLALIGETGVGKTHLMTAALKALAREGKSARYVNERQIYREIHESYLGRKDLPTESQIIDRYSNVDVLGIDEIGRSSWTEHESQTLYEIIDNRSVSGRKTFMAGNLTLVEFNAKYDESFQRKLGAEVALCAWRRNAG
ncbi:MAG: ATP-binding protein [Sphaerochaetaceae bacterium]|nr:ATP-binding protein [Sphaerochaetaceae bacterium]